MYELFTDRCRRAMQLANQEAQRLNHEYLGTEHILLGLLDQAAGIGHTVLTNLGVNLLALRLVVEQRLQPCPELTTMGRLPMTPRSKSVIEHAVREATALQHNYIGTEHLLLGLLQADGIAGEVLRGAGLTAERCREEVLTLLGQPPKPTAGYAIGPPVASGAIAEITLTYSAIDPTTGAIAVRELWLLKGQMLTVGLEWDVGPPTKLDVPPDVRPAAPSSPETWRDRPPLL